VNAATMTNLSSIEAALIEHNPFAQPPFVTSNNIWGKGFPDVESLNSHASDVVFKALQDIQAGLYPCTSILITAQDGTGKSHVISRIRHKLQDIGGTFFILANKFSDLNKLKPGFQQLVAESLFNIGIEGVKQWQELATAMTNSVARANNSGIKLVEAKDLVKKFENATNEKQVSEWINKLTKAFCKLKSVQDPEVVRAIFWTLSDDEAPFASNWLGGKELAEYKANDLRLPLQNQSFETTLQILGLISDYNSLIICFDELDIADFNDNGLRKAQVITNLVKELVENIKRGVILSVMMPGTWTDEVYRKMPAAVSTKVMTSGNPINLQYLDSDTTVDLVSFFLKDYYDARELTPPYFLYPFDESQLRSIGQGRPTVREVLKWCRENCHPGMPPPPIQSPVEVAFNAEMNESLENLLDDNYLIADSLFDGFQSIIGQTLEEVTLTEVRAGFGKKAKKDSYLNFKIIGKDNGNEFRIGVAVLQYDGGRALGAGFRRLLDSANEFDLTRGCLVRSPNKPINKFFQETYLNPLIKDGGEFVKLLEKDIKPLIALRSVYQKRKSDYALTEEQIQQFIQEKGEQYLLGIYNPLLREILSDPSYEMPADLEDEPDCIYRDDSSDRLDISEDFTELLEI
jgi:hypothetical protein